MLLTRQPPESDISLPSGGGVELLDSLPAPDSLSVTDGQAGGSQTTAVEEQARRRIWESGSYAFEFRHIQLQFRDGCLTLRGQLPSFHLKQTLQTCLKGLSGVARIENQVVVVDPAGQTD